MEKKQTVVASSKSTAAAMPAGMAAKGGRARAAKLTPERKREIASAASKERWKSSPIKVTFAGQINIGDTVLECANLPDGRRVLAEITVMEALGRGYSGYYSQRDASATEAGSDVVPRYLSPGYLQPYIGEELKGMIASPIWYVTPKGKMIAKGIDAEALPLICDSWLQARENGALDKTPAAHKSAKMAELLVRGLARVGIAALIDEATGYQAERNKRALQAILDRFLVKELAEWAKMFPDQFYEQIFRLRGWVWRGRSFNPPQVVSYYTKDLVYARLAPGLMKEMQGLAAKEPKSHKLHQWLSKEGRDALQAHFLRLLALMQASTSWEQMMSMVDNVLPKQGATLMLPFMATADPLPSDSIEL